MLLHDQKVSNVNIEYRSSYRVWPFQQPRKIT